jgi:hypothetical protein
LEEIVNIEKSFSFPFEDKEWTSKLGLGAAIALVPILNFAWYGYMVGIIRNVMNEVTEPLPTWDDFGKRFTDGLILFAAGIIYALPIFLLVCLPLSVLAFSGVLSGVRDMEDAARTIAGAGGALFVGVLCIAGLYGLLLSILHPAILVMFAREGTFASCFKVREALDMISRHAGPFFIAWAMGLAASLGVGMIVAFANAIISWIPCVGWIVGLGLSALSGVYIAAVYGHLFGQFGREAFGQSQIVAVG